MNAAHVAHVVRASLAAAAYVVVSAVVALPLGLSSPAAHAADDMAVDEAARVRGETLALIGNCDTCHTADGGASYAGGRPLRTPFGVIYAPNITPDPDTGIGRWSYAAFERAMRDGVRADGEPLYPAFPYDHYTHLGSDDMRALYAYLSTREPVRAAAPSNRLRFPYNVRAFVRIWQAMYLRHGPFVPDPEHDATWNRGAYLVTALGHCGACHTPRDALGAERRDAYLAGGESEGWRAPTLVNASRPWTVEALARYLATGLADDREIAAGPMAPVVHNLARVPADDVRAMAVYLASLSTPDAAARRESSPIVATAGAAGASIYDAACAPCHAGSRGDTSRDALGLEQSTSVALDTPDNFVRIVMHGIVPRDGGPGRLMPPFAAVLSDAQVAMLAEYVRARYAHAAPWPDVARLAAQLRRDSATTMATQ